MVEKDKCSFLFGIIRFFSNKLTFEGYRLHAHVCIICFYKTGCKYEFIKYELHNKVSHVTLIIILLQIITVIIITIIIIIITIIDII